MPKEHNSRICGSRSRKGARHSKTAGTAALSLSIMQHASDSVSHADSCPCMSARLARSQPQAPLLYHVSRLELCMQRNNHSSYMAHHKPYSTKYARQIPCACGKMPAKLLPAGHVCCSDKAATKTVVRLHVIPKLQSKVSRNLPHLRRVTVSTAAQSPSLLVVCDMHQHQLHRTQIAASWHCRGRMNFKKLPNESLSNETT
jgi:hypothetical protein